MAVRRGWVWERYLHSPAFPPQGLADKWHHVIIIDDDTRKQCRGLLEQHSEGYERQAVQYDLVYDLEIAQQMAAALRQVIGDE